LVEFLHFSFYNFFFFKNIAIFLLIPLLEPDFDMFEYFLKKENSCALNIQVFSPPNGYIVAEIWVGEPDVFKSKRSIRGVTNALNF